MAQDHSTCERRWTDTGQEEERRWTDTGQEEERRWTDTGQEEEPRENHRRRRAWGAGGKPGEAVQAPRGEF